MTNFSKVKQYSLLFLAFFALLLSPLIYAADAPAVGQVVWVRGEVQAVSATNVSRTLQRRSPVYQQDTITTSDTSSGEIVFTDNSVVSLRSGTVFKIDQYKYNPANSSDSKYVASVAKGGFRTITGLISKQKPENYQVNTPVATIGVRGTDYTLFYQATKGLSVMLTHGRIYVVNAEGQLELDAAKNRIYAEIADIHHKPTLTNTAPSSLKGQPAIMKVPFGPGGPGTGGTGGTGPGSTTTTGTTAYSPNGQTGKTNSATPGSSQQVSGFCIQ